MTASPSSLRISVANLLTAASCVLLALVSAALAPPGVFPAPLWLPAGLGFAVLVAVGPQLLPGLWAGHAVAGFLVAGAAWPVAGLVGFGAAGSAWVGAMLFRRLLPEGLVGSTLAPVHFLAVAYGCAVLDALFGPMVLWLGGAAPAGGLDAHIVDWWLADALGIVVLAPPLLAWAKSSAGSLFGRCRALPAAVAATTTALALLTFVAGRIVLPDSHLQAALLLPLLIWLAMHCRSAVALSVNLVVVGSLAYAATWAIGPLMGETVVERAYTLHGFALISSGMLLFLSAHIHLVRKMAAEARAGEERFRRLTALSSDWYWEQDADFRFVFFDGPVLGDAVKLPPLLLGRQRGELPGVEPYNTRWEAHSADLDAHRTFVGMILRYARPDGAVSFYSISGEPRYDEDGRFAGYRGVGRDVTPEIESREALLASERQFHAVANATFEGLFIHDYGRIVFANQAFAESVGYAIDDIVGRLALDFVSPEERENVIKQLASDAPVRNYETIGLRADGHRFPVEVFGRPFVFQGKPMRIAAVRDIGAHRATEAVLGAQVAFQRTLLDTLPNPVFYKDRDGCYLGYNRAFCEAFGIGAADYLGKSVLDLVPGDMGRKFKASDDALFAQPGIQAYEESVQTQRGMREMMVYKDVFKNGNGENGGLIGVLVDVTERKQIESRLQRFLELSPAAIGIVDTGGRVLYINPAASELFGFTKADVPTMEDWWALAYPDAAYREDRRKAWIAAVEQTLREGRNMLRFEGRVRCRDGRERWIETLTSLGEQEIFMIFTDLTDYVEVEPEPVR